MRVHTRGTAGLLMTVLLFGCADAGDSGTGGAAAELTSSDATAQELANEQVILDFFEAWSRLDPTEIASYFTDDGIYHNMPSEPVQGRDNVEALIRGFSAQWTETTWEVLTIMSAGDTVIAERVDRTTAGDRSVDLPVIGVFELENGRIKEWRDYFDLGTYTRAFM